MTIERVLLVVLFLFGVLYVVLGLTAFAHRLDDERRTQILSASPWWALYKSIYNKPGRRLARIGQWLILLEFLGILVLLVLKGIHQTH